MKKHINLIIIVTLLIQYIFCFSIEAAGTTTLNVSKYSYVTASKPSTVSSGSVYTLEPEQKTENAVYYLFDISSFKLPAGNYISQVRVKMNLYQNDECENGELLCRYVEEYSWNSNKLTYNTAPSAEGIIGKKSGISLVGAGKVERIDITPYFAEMYYKNSKYICFALSNSGESSIKLKVSQLEITYTSTESSFDFSGISYYIEQFSEKNRAVNGAQGQQMYVDLSAVGISSAGENLNIAVASYDENGILKDVDTFNKKLYASAADSVNVIDFKHSDTPGYTKTYVWGNAFEPYCEPAYFTEKSVAMLSSASVSDAEMYPEFNENIYEYIIYTSDDVTELPTVTYTYSGGMKVKEKIAESLNEDTVISVTSSDLNKTVDYVFNYAVKKSAVITADRIAVKKGADAPAEISLPVNEDTDEDGDVLYLSFDKSFFAEENALITELELEFFARSNSSEQLEVYRNPQHNLSEINCEPESIPIGEEGMLGDAVEIKGKEFEKYSLKLNPTEFDGFSDLELCIKGKPDIWCGKNNVETYNGMRIPSLKVTYGLRNEKAPVLRWDDRTIDVTYAEYNVLPVDKYQSTQNPPSFVWQYVDFAESYDIIVAKDEKLNHAVYSKSENKLNLYNFPCIFESGTYYWSVRIRGGNEVSEWQTPRRFTVLADAYEYPVPDVSDINKRITETEHPRLITTPDDIETFRSYKDGVSSEIYSDIIADTEAAMKSPLTDEPTSVEKLSKEVSNVITQIDDAILAYLISGNAKYGDFAKKILLAVAEWKLDYEEGITSYKNDSQTYREIIFSCAHAYDSIYNIMSEEERKIVEDMLIHRAIFIENPPEGLQDAPYLLEKTPYVSHGWGNSEAVMTTAIALMGISEELDNIFKKYLPRYIAMSANQRGYQDGSEAGGYAYTTFYSEALITRALKNMNIIDMTKCAQFRDSWKFMFYSTFNLTSMEFGDGSEGYGATMNSSYVLKRYAMYSDSPYARWKYENIAMPMLHVASSYFDAIGTEVPSKEPHDLPKSEIFKDTGYVIMHSDLIDEDKVSLYFRSSPFGSSSHAHADNNSFHIQAFGERLAIDSGYYDTSASDHAVNYRRQTYAHNGVTHSGGIGQANKASQAKGKITGFITGENFDLASGDASTAYNYYNGKWNRVTYEKRMDKAMRHIIYVRPDSFIVIDDLKAKDKDETTFEWWLNASENIKFYDDRNGACIIGKEAQLEAEVVYPANIRKGGISEDFEDMNGNIYSPEKNYSYLPKHSRVWFETPEANKAKIVSVINVHKRSERYEQAVVTDKENYIKISFKDGTSVYVNTSDNETVTTDDGYIFDGLAFAVKGNAFMIVNGTRFEKDGKKLFASDKETSLLYEPGGLSVSSENDVKVELNCGRVYEATDRRGNIISEDTEEELGIGVVCGKEKTKITAKSGFYSLRITSAIGGAIPVTNY